MVCRMILVQQAHGTRTAETDGGVLAFVLYRTGFIVKSIRVFKHRPSTQSK